MATADVTHKLTDPSGTAVVGVIIGARLNRRGFRTVDGSEVTGSEFVTSSGTGEVTMTLERNVDITPIDTWWVVTIFAPEFLGGRQIYCVKSTVNQTLHASRFDPSP